MRAARNMSGLVLAATVTMIGFAGCGFMTWSRLSFNDPIKPDDVAFIVSGQTTFAEVIAKLGAPDQLIGLKEGAVARYQFRDVKYFRVNFGWPLRFVLLENPDFVLANTGLGADVFQVTFDRGWVVQQHAFAKHQEAAQYRLWPF